MDDLLHLEDRERRLRTARLLGDDGGDSGGVDLLATSSGLSRNGIAATTSFARLHPLRQRRGDVVGSERLRISAVWEPERKSLGVLHDDRDRCIDGKVLFVGSVEGEGEEPIRLAARTFSFLWDRRDDPLQVGVENVLVLLLTHGNDHRVAAQRSGVDLKDPRASFRVDEALPRADKVPAEAGLASTEAVLGEHQLVHRRLAVLGAARRPDREAEDRREVDEVDEEQFRI